MNKNLRGHRRGLLLSKPKKSLPPTSRLEEEAHQEGYRTVAGVDEAGRGALAGPVVAGAVLLDPTNPAPWMFQLRDSKLLSSAERARLALLIQSEALAWNYGEVTAHDVDLMGIISATRLAMQRAVRGLSIVPDLLLVDGLPPGYLGPPTRNVIRGDATCRVIAAASIIAKVFRDRMMLDLDSCYPGYGFARHKGYGTAEHVSRLRTLGPSLEHRNSYQPIRGMLTGFLSRPLGH